MKNAIISAFLIFSAAPAALMAGALEDLSGMAGTQLTEPGLSVSPPVPGRAETAGGTQPQAAADAAIYSAAVPLYLGKENMAAVSKKLEAAGYVVLSSWVQGPEGYPVLEWYYYKLEYAARPGGVTHKFLSRSGHRADSEKAALEAAAAAAELEEAGFVVLSSLVLPGYLPFNGWTFQIDYILPAGAA